MISVIVPLYNVEKYIEACLESFEKQTISDFELILVDDNSIDGSKCIVKEFMNNSMLSIKLIQLEKNEGVSNARNIGFLESKGEYICFVDADDMIRPTYLEYLYILISTKGVDMAICQTQNIREDGSILDLYEVNIELKYQINSSLEVLRKILYHKIKVGIWDVMFKKEIAIKGDCKFAKGYAYSEDLDYIWRICNCAEKIAVIYNKLYLYRIRNNSAMSIMNEKRIDGFNLMKNLEGYFMFENPDFYFEFINYGVARWVWATMWQCAIASSNYKEFEQWIVKFQAVTYMKKLNSYNDLKVRYISKLFCFNSRLYYKLIKSKTFKLIAARKDITYK